MAKYTPLKSHRPRNTRWAYRDKTDLHNRLTWVQQERESINHAVSDLRLELVRTTRGPGFVHRDYRETNPHPLPIPVMYLLWIGGSIAFSMAAFALAGKLGEYYGR